jgi:hypothetical protein
MEPRARVLKFRFKHGYNSFVKTHGHAYLPYLTYLVEHMKNRVYGFHDELMMEESGCVTQI